MLTVARYGTRDLARARTFYDAIGELLGARRVFDRDELSGYQGPSGVMFIIGMPFEGEASVGNGTQVVFDAPSRAAVDAVHERALALGGSSEGAPGFRGPADLNFYAAYFRDPDGNKILVAKSGPE